MAEWTSSDDGCLSLFLAAKKAAPIVFPAHARILEVGCAEADWIGPMLSERPDLRIVGIDWRDSGPRDPRATIIRGDVMDGIDFPAGYFDAAVGVSSLEHIGLGHYHDDPRDPNGDRRCLANLARWVRPGGQLYFDVPFGATFRTIDTSYREYDRASLRWRFGYECWAERWCGFVEAGQPATLLSIVAAQEAGSGEGSSPSHCVACLWERQ